MIISEEKKIIVCPECNGLGLTEIRTSVDDSEIRVCKYCDGARVIEEKVTLEHNKGTDEFEKKVIELRYETGCTLLDCKNTLTETKGNKEKAVDLLREKYLGVLVNRRR